MIPTGDTVLPCCEDMVTPMEFRLKGQRLSLDRPLLMGIVNVTPDSFFDGGRFCDPQRAVAHAKCVVADNRYLFVSSANFTEASQNRNLEAGVLVDSTTLAAKMVEFLEGLIRERRVRSALGRRFGDPVD